MAQDAVVAELALKGPLETVYIVDALANKGAFAEKILVYIGRQTRIGVDPLYIALHPGIERGDTRWHLRVDPGLKDPISLHHPPLFLTVHRLIQRVRHRRDHFPGSLARQMSIGIERD